MSQQQKALLLLSKQGKLEVGARPIPSSPQGKQALVKVTAAAINPVDWMIVDLGIFVTEFPSVLGFDAAGVIESVGPEVTAFQKGDRVLFQGSVTPSDEAAFQQYATADTEAMAKIPSGITNDQASTIPLGSISSLYGLFQKSGVKFPKDGPTTADRSIFITGGSSSLGQFAIQFARIAGFSTIATTASAQHTEFLKSLGATHVFDRNLSLEAIQAAVPLPFHQVFNIIPNPTTDALCVGLLTTPHSVPSAHFGTVSPYPLEESLKNRIEGKTTFHAVFGSSRLDRGLSVPYWQVLTRWLEEGKIVPNPVQLVGGGLAGAIEAFEMSRKGVSGVKLVVRPQE